MNEIDRVKKLFALVIVAFVWAYKAGIYLNNLCPIKTKKHGRKEPVQIWANLFV